MKILAVKNVLCPQCGKINVTYHAKNMCKQCYYRIYMRKYNKILKDEKFNLKVSTVDKFKKA